MFTDWKIFFMSVSAGRVWREWLLAGFERSDTWLQLLLPICRVLSLTKIRFLGGRPLVAFCKVSTASLNSAFGQLLRKETDAEAMILH